MNFFKRLKILLSGFFTSALSNQESERTKNLVEGTIIEYQKKMKKINEAVCNLIFQKKKLENKLSDNKFKMSQLSLNIEELVKTGKDELALKLISKLDTLKDESVFVTEQVKQIDKDIQEGRKTEKQLIKKIGGSGEQLRLLGGRIEALKLRKNLQEDLNAMSNEVKEWNSENSIQKLQDQAMKLEVELEVQNEKNELDDAVLSIEKDQQDSRHLNYLNEIKNKLDMPRQIYGQVVVKA